MGVVKMAFLDEEIGERNDVEISGAIGRNNVGENGFNVGIDTPAARKGLGAALRVGVNGAANFRKGLRYFALAQQKISVAPGDGGGYGIRVARLDIGVAGSGEVAFGFVDSAEVEPGVGVARI